MRLVIIKATLECSVENVCGSISKVNKQSIRKEWHVSGMPSYLSMGSALGSRQWAYTSGETGGAAGVGAPFCPESVESRLAMIQLNWRPRACSCSDFKWIPGPRLESVCSSLLRCLPSTDRTWCNSKCNGRSKRTPV